MSTIVPHGPDTDNACDLELLDWADLQPPCDARNRMWHPVHGTGHARWVVRVKPCCDTHVALFCDGCKELLLTTEQAMTSARDGHRHAPAREAVVSVDAL